MADTRIIGTSARALPAARADGLGPSAADYVRVSRYGDTVIGLSPRRQAADEGAYFVATNPTPGTAIQFAAAGEGAAFAASTKCAIFVVANNNSAGGKRIYLDRLKLFLGGTAPTGTLQMDFAFELDNITRVATAPTNQVAITPVNVNSDDTTASQASIWFPTTSPLTVTAATGAVKLAGRASLVTGVAVVGDEYELVFGEDVPSGSGGLTAARATDPCRIVSSAPPIIIGPQKVCVARFRWITQATNAWSSEFELGYIEK